MDRLASIDILKISFLMSGDCFSDMSIEQGTWYVPTELQIVSLVTAAGLGQVELQVGSWVYWVSADQRAWCMVQDP